MTEVGSCSTSKRKSSPVFRTEWEDLYLFTESEGVAKCLICHKTLNQLKRFNLKRHYNIYHSKDYNRYKDEDRAAEVFRLKEIFNQEERNFDFINCGLSDCTEPETKYDPSNKNLYSKKRTAFSVEASPTRLISVEDSRVLPKVNSVEPEDECDVAGKKLAFDLRKMDDKQRIIAEKIINDVVFYGKLGQLNENSSLYDTPPHFNLGLTTKPAHVTNSEMDDQKPDNCLTTKPPHVNNSQMDDQRPDN